MLVVLWRLMRAEKTIAPKPAVLRIFFSEKDVGRLISFRKEFITSIF